MSTRCVLPPANGGVGYARMRLAKIALEDLRAGILWQFVDEHDVLRHLKSRELLSAMGQYGVCGQVGPVADDDCCGDGLDPSWVWYAEDGYLRDLIELIDDFLDLPAGDVLAAPS